MMQMGNKQVETKISNLVYRICAINQMFGMFRKFNNHPFEK